MSITQTAERVNPDPVPKRNHGAHDPRFRAEVQNSTSRELDAWAWSLAVQIAEARNESTRSFVLYRFGVVQREREIREQVSDPLAPARSSSARYDLERIKEEITLDLFLPIATGIDLDWKGSRWAARCPFPDHDDKTASLSVSGDGQLFYCFGCGRGGDLFVFSQEWFASRSFIAAVEFAVETMHRHLDDFRLAPVEIARSTPAAPSIVPPPPKRPRVVPSLEYRSGQLVSR